MPLADFPDAIEGQAPCGSRCRFHDAAELGPDGLQAAIEMEFMVRLVARYNVEGSGFGALFLEFTTPGIACYVEVGYHAATDKLKCCFLSYIGLVEPVDVEPADMHAVPFKLTLVCMGEYMPLGNSWVSCVNERMLLSDLCRQYGGVWGVNLLKQTPYDLRSVIVSERIAIDFDELRAMETARLEALAAKAVFSKMMRSRKKMEARKTRARKSRKVDDGKACTEEDATASSEASEGAA